tara:strand:- start:2729 stop:3568 length:840 start_codon:yes stop_codon:yes gene_type:complete
MMSIFLNCGGNEQSLVFTIAGIPDQNSTELARRYQEFTNYLSQTLQQEVKYVPTVNYSATVTGFRQGEIHMAWFGGLTGVMARMDDPNALAIAQRPADEKFHSVFIINQNVSVDKGDLSKLKGITFTFGDELSTSGHLMPRHFLLEAGLNPDEDFASQPSYSGSHDKTWKLVESGAFDGGVLNENVWRSAVDLGKVDVSKVQVFYKSPPYHDYNWTIRGDLDETFGLGFTQNVKNALMDLDNNNSEILKMFSTDSFVATKNSNYDVIESIAVSVGIIEQ